MIWTYNHNISAQLVVCSLGIGQSNPYWEWAGDNYSTIKQFCWPLVKSMDVCMWVKDLDGLVYDVPNQYKLDITKFHDKLVWLTQP